MATKKKIWRPSRKMYRSVLRAIYYVGEIHVLSIDYKKPILPSSWQHNGFYSAAIIRTCIFITMYVNFEGDILVDRRDENGNEIETYQLKSTPVDGFSFQRGKLNKLIF